MEKTGNEHLTTLALQTLFLFFRKLAAKRVQRVGDAAGRKSPYFLVMLVFFPIKTEVSGLIKRLHIASLPPATS